MNYSNKSLNVFVEGKDDEKFFNSAIKPLFERSYKKINYVKFAELKTKDIINLIKGIKAVDNDFLFIADLDMYQCVSQKKEAINKLLADQYNSDKTFIVVKEIESWYMAGLDEKDSKVFFGKDYRETNDMTKEFFSQHKKSEFGSDIDFKAEILKHFSIETACRKNKSFNYFYTKFFKTEDR